jgi:hypothetical protein
MTQILPKFEDIKFSTSHNVYYKAKQEPLNLFTKKQEGAVVALLHSIINRLFGSTTITKNNILVVTECAIKNLDNIDCTQKDLLEARKVTDQMQLVLPNNPKIKELQTKIDTKIIAQNAKEFYDYKSNTRSISDVRNAIKKDITRTGDSLYNGQQVTDMLDHKNNFEGTTLKQKAVILANCQLYQPFRNAVAYGFDTNYFVKSQDENGLWQENKVDTILKQEYSIKKSDNEKITVAVTASWSLQNKNLISVESELIFDITKIKQIFNQEQNSNEDELIMPLTAHTITNVKIEDKDFLKRSLANQIDDSGLIL